MAIASEAATSTTFEQHSEGDRCPIDHATLSQQKTGRTVEPEGKPIERGAAGVWHVRGFLEVRAVLRSTEVKQAGLGAELVERAPGGMTPPILYQEGEQHQQQRKQIARFFTPGAVSTDYRQLMEALSDRIVGVLKRKGRADLSDLSMSLAVRVAAQIVGLTDSLLPGMDRRLNAFLSGNISAFGWRPRALVGSARNYIRMAQFFYLDVRPAIRARRREPRADVVSHLLERGYRDSEILTECLTYAAAGMATTREFMCAAAWHLLEQPALRVRFMRGTEAERHAILHELLRLEPVVGHLYRQTTGDLEIESDGATVTIPAGELVDLHIYAANTDRSIVPQDRLLICPGRTINADRTGPALMSFGDGHHRCPGAPIAIQETDIFLQRLLALDTLRIERKPSVTWEDLTATYEIRGFIIAVD